MKNLIIAFLFSGNLFALESPFKSTVEGLTIPNSHKVGKNENFYRGMGPTAYKKGKLIFDKTPELKKFGFTDILIFKKEAQGTVKDEIERLKKIGYTDSQITHIPFDWFNRKNSKNYHREACKQTLDGLRKIHLTTKDKKRKLFLHCTVGEDRTGMLTGLYRMISERLGTEKAYYCEMCGRGYSAGNPNKPFKEVVLPIRRDIMPLFRHMATSVRKWDITKKDLELGTKEFASFRDRYCRFNGNFQPQKTDWTCDKKEVLKRCEIPQVNRHLFL